MTILTKLSILMLVLVQLTGGIAFAQERVKTTDGRELILHSDGTYEDVTKSNANASGAYKQYSITDLKLDMRDLVGKQVEVDVQLMMMGDMLMLSDPGADVDANPISAEDAGLSREERRFILNRCGMGCNVTVRGEVAQSLFGTELHIHSIK